MIALSPVECDLICILLVTTMLLIQQIKLSLHLKLAPFLRETGTKLVTFLHLPPPVLVHIAVFLELQHRLSLAFSSAKSKRALFSAPQLWNRVYPSFKLNTPKGVCAPRPNRPYETCPSF